MEGELIDASGRPEFRNGGIWLNKGRRLPLEIPAVRIVSLRNFRNGGSDFCELEELRDRFDYVVFSGSCFMDEAEKLYILDAIGGRVLNECERDEWIKGKVVNDFDSKMYLRDF